MNNFLRHYGIKGQSWGIRRFQNEDGTLTEEGKRRYYDSLTSYQKRIYDDKMNDRQRREVQKKMSEGKTWAKATREMTEEHRQRVNNIVGIAATAGVMYLSPITRGLMKAAARDIFRAGKTLFRAAKNSNAAQRGKMFMQQIMKRRQMVKNGAVQLKKSAYSVKDTVIPFGGYLT